MKQPRHPFFVYTGVCLAILLSLFVIGSVAQKTQPVTLEKDTLQKPGTVTPSGDKVYASSGRPQPDPFKEPEEAREYMHKIALRYNSYWELPEPDQRLFRGLGAGQGEVIYKFMRNEALQLKAKAEKK